MVLRQERGVLLFCYVSTKKIWQAQFFSKIFQLPGKVLNTDTTPHDGKRWQHGDWKRNGVSCGSWNILYETCIFCVYSETYCRNFKIVLSLCRFIVRNHHSHSITLSFCARSCFLTIDSSSSKRALLCTTGNLLCDFNGFL